VEYRKKWIINGAANQTHAVTSATAQKNESSTSPADSCATTANKLFSTAHSDNIAALKYIRSTVWKYIHIKKQQAYVTISRCQMPRASGL